MHIGKIVFSQVMDFLPMHEFRKCVQRYQGNYKVQSFSCFDQFLCMAFAQLTYRESLRDIEACLRAVPNKLYHMGMRGNIARSTLAEANEKRNWLIYADFAQILINIARALYRNEDFGLDSITQSYLWTNRKEGENGNWSVEVYNNKIIPVNHSTVFTGDIVATGATWESNLDILIESYKGEAHLDRIIFFALGSEKAEDAFCEYLFQDENTRRPHQQLSWKVMKNRENCSQAVVFF